MISPPSSPSPPQSVEQLFNAARQCAPRDRAAFLDHACGNSASLRRLIEERLQAEGYSSGTSPSWSLSAPSAAASAPTRGQSRFREGQLIAGRFEVVRFIDRGGMGEVYEVEDRFLQGVHVALKMVLPEIASDADSARRFKEEVLNARRANHPHLCPIYDIALCEDPPPPFLFFTMKLLAGETLSARLRREEPISREDKIAVLRQMVAGIAAIHAAGVVHRDIKPKNVMLDRSGPELCITIMDFGLARLHEGETTIGTNSMAAGTPGYMAPELIREGPSQAADLYALGVLLHQVLAGERPSFSPSNALRPSPALAASGVPPALMHAVEEFLSPAPDRRCRAFEQIQSVLDPTHPAATWKSLVASEHSGWRPLSRRQFAAGSALTALAAVSGVAWKWDRIENLLHPLPGKRFVALVGWPAPSEPRMQAMISSVVDAIGSELARAEASDRNLYIIPHALGKEAASISQLNDLRQSLGANLVLAASAEAHSGDLRLLLRVLDPATGRTLRQGAVGVALEDQLLLPEKAVRAAASLLDITRYTPDDQRSKVGTDSPEAYQAFQSAEALRKQDNDAGLDAAIEQYKQAIEIDPRYALAQARLAWAYLRSYGLHGDPAALDLAGLNCKSAIEMDPDLVDAHLGVASFYQKTGDDESASREMAKALSLDPSNTHTLIYQADFYAAQNRWDEAEQTFNRIFNLRPNDWLAHQELGVVLDLQGRYREALSQFRLASLASPRNALARKNVGTTYLELGNLAEAVDNLNASFALKPDDYAAEGLAEAFRVQHRYPEAVSYAQRATGIEPNDPSHWLELGDVYTSAGKFRSEADAAYRRAAQTQQEKLQTSPKDGPGWMLLALCQAKSGEAEKALTLIARAESMHADDIDSQLFKVRILELAGRREQALSTVQRCLSRSPVSFQLDTMPDLERLRTTPEYKSMVSSNVSPTQISLRLLNGDRSWARVPL